jgi:hypothetical protein
MFCRGLQGFQFIITDQGGVPAFFEGAVNENAFSGGSRNAPSKFVHFHAGIAPDAFFM